MAGFNPSKWSIEPRDIAEGAEGAEAGTMKEEGELKGEAESNKKEKKQFRNENVAGLFFHIMSDALGSVAVIVSAVCIRHYNLLIADPICSLAISALIVFSILSLLRSTIRTLTLRVSADVNRELKALTNQVLAIPSVAECENIKLWQFRRNELVLTGKVTLKAECNLSDVQCKLQKVSGTYAILHRMIEVEPDSSFLPNGH